MIKEEISVLVQLLSAMKENAEALEIARRNKDDMKMLKIKREIIKFQKKVEELL